MRIGNIVDGSGRACFNRLLTHRKGIVRNSYAYLLAKIKFTSLLKILFRTNKETGHCNRGMLFNNNDYVSCLLDPLNLFVQVGLLFYDETIFNSF